MRIRTARTKAVKQAESRQQQEQQCGPAAQRDDPFGALSKAELDAQQVIELISAEERKALSIPGDIRDEKFCQELVRRAVDGLADWISW
jgi:hypothetical protein